MTSPAFDPETVNLDALLKRLHLANTGRNWRTLCARAEAEQWSPRHFLAVLLTEEIAQRRNTRLQRELRQAGFPFLKTVEEFDFTLQSTLKLSLLGSYLGPELVSEGRNLVLYGKTGRGKTHLAIAVGYRAIQNGFTSRFVVAAELLDELAGATSKGRLKELVGKYVQPHVLVIDELGYLKYGPDAANMLFHVVNERHGKKRPLIFTTNKSPITQWGAQLHDQDLAEAIVDRVMERGRLLKLDGPSYRTKHLKDEPGSGNPTKE